MFYPYVKGNLYSGWKIFYFWVKPNLYAEVKKCFTTELRGIFTLNLKKFYVWAERNLYTEFEKFYACVNVNLYLTALVLT